MSAGRYRVPVILQQPVDVRAPDGEVTRSFETVGTVFASLRLVGQAEQVDGGQLHTRRAYDLRLRPFSGFEGGWRIVVGARVFRVLSTSDPNLRNREWVCRVEEEGA